jgi:ribosomal-protein-alanine N-acetyltransferase
VTAYPNSAEIEIQTERLRLLPLSVASLQLYLDDPVELERQLGLSVSRDILTDRVQRAIRMKISKMHVAPIQDHVWYTYWLVVIVQEKYGAGLAGFKGIETGKREVEIGYGIDPACQSQGYVTEAVHAMVKWAFNDSSCQRITARKVLRMNKASLRVLEKAGFRIFAEREDSYDLMIEKRRAVNPHQHSKRSSGG